MATIVQPSFLQAFTQLGVYLQGYLTFQTLLHTFGSPCKNDEWNRLTRTEVYKMDDPSFELDTAYQLLEKQNHLCKKCNCFLTLDRNPITVKEIRNFNFWGMYNQETKFSWVCSACHGKKAVQEEDLHAKIERLITEEELHELNDVE